MSGKNEGGWSHGWRGWIRFVIVPLLIALPAFRGLYVWGFLQARAEYEHTHLPVEPNPSTSIAGSWTVEFADVTAYEAVAGESTPVPPLRAVAQADPQRVQDAQILIDSDGPRFSGTASSGGRHWQLEGYVDHDAILYVYKDIENPNSFVSGFLRRVGVKSEYAGLWSGVCPGF